MTGKLVLIILVTFLPHFVHLHKEVKPYNRHENKHLSCCLCKRFPVKPVCAAGGATFTNQCFFDMAHEFYAAKGIGLPKLYDGPCDSKRAGKYDQGHLVTYHGNKEYKFIPHNDPTMCPFLYDSPSVHGHGGNAHHLPQQHYPPAGHSAISTEAMEKKYQEVLIHLEDVSIFNPCKNDPRGHHIMPHRLGGGKIRGGLAGRHRPYAGRPPMPLQHHPQHGHNHDAKHHGPLFRHSYESHVGIADNFHQAESKDMPKLPHDQGHPHHPQKTPFSASHGHHVLPDDRKGVSAQLSNLEIQEESTQVPVSATTLAGSNTHNLKATRKYSKPVTNFPRPTLTYFKNRAMRPTNHNVDLPSSFEHSDWANIDKRRKKPRVRPNMSGAYAEYTKPPRYPAYTTRRKYTTEQSFQRPSYTKSSTTVITTPGTTQKSWTTATTSSATEESSTIEYTISTSSMAVSTTPSTTESSPTVTPSTMEISSTTESGTTEGTTTGSSSSTYTSPTTPTTMTHTTTSPTMTHTTTSPTMTHTTTSPTMTHTTTRTTSTTVLTTPTTAQATSTFQTTPATTPPTSTSTSASTTSSRPRSSKTSTKSTSTHTGWKATSSTQETVESSSNQPVDVVNPWWWMDQELNNQTEKTSNDSEIQQWAVRTIFLSPDGSSNDREFTSSHLRAPDFPDDDQFHLSTSKFKSPSAATESSAPIGILNEHQAIEETDKPNLAVDESTKINSFEINDNQNTFQRRHKAKARTSINANGSDTQGAGHLPEEQEDNNTPAAVETTLVRLSSCEELDQTSPEGESDANEPRVSNSSSDINVPRASPCTKVGENQSNHQVGAQATVETNSQLNGDLIPPEENADDGQGPIDYDYGDDNVTQPTETTQHTEMGDGVTFQYDDNDFLLNETNSSDLPIQPSGHLPLNQMNDTYDSRPANASVVPPPCAKVGRNQRTQAAANTDNPSAGHLLLASNYSGETSLTDDHYTEDNMTVNVDPSASPSAEQGNNQQPQNVSGLAAEENYDQPTDEDPSSTYENSTDYPGPIDYDYGDDNATQPTETTQSSVIGDAVTFHYDDDYAVLNDTYSPNDTIQSSGHIPLDHLNDTYESVNATASLGPPPCAKVGGNKRTQVVANRNIPSAAHILPISHNSVENSVNDDYGTADNMAANSDPSGTPSSEYNHNASVLAIAETNAQLNGDLSPPEDDAEDGQGPVDYNYVDANATQLTETTQASEIDDAVTSLYDEANTVLNNTDPSNCSFYSSADLPLPPSCPEVRGNQNIQIVNNKDNATAAYVLPGSQYSCENSVDCDDNTTDNITADADPSLSPSEEHAYNVSGVTAVETNAQLNGSLSPSYENVTDEQGPINYDYGDDNSTQPTETTQGSAIGDIVTFQYDDDYAVSSITNSPNCSIHSSGNLPLPPSCANVSAVNQTTQVVVNKDNPSAANTLSGSNYSCENSVNCDEGSTGNMTADADQSTLPSPEEGNNQQPQNVSGLAIQEINDQPTDRDLSSTYENATDYPGPIDYDYGDDNATPPTETTQSSVIGDAITFHYDDDYAVLNDTYSPNDTIQSSGHIPLDNLNDTFDSVNATASLGPPPCAKVGENQGIQVVGKAESTTVHSTLEEEELMEEPAAATAVTMPRTNNQVFEEVNIAQTTEPNTIIVEEEGETVYPPLTVTNPDAHMRVVPSNQDDIPAFNVNPHYINEASDNNKISENSEPEKPEYKKYDQQPKLYNYGGSEHYVYKIPLKPQVIPKVEYGSSNINQQDYSKGTGDRGGSKLYDYQQSLPNTDVEFPHNENYDPYASPHQTVAQGQQIDPYIGQQYEAETHDLMAGSVAPNTLDDRGYQATFNPVDHETDQSYQYNVEQANFSPTVYVTYAQDKYETSPDLHEGESSQNVGNKDYLVVMPHSDQTITENYQPETTVAPETVKPLKQTYFSEYLKRKQPDTSYDYSHPWRQYLRYGERQQTAYPQAVTSYTTTVYNSENVEMKKPSRTAENDAEGIEYSNIL